MRMKLGLRCRRAGRDGWASIEVMGVEDEAIGQRGDEGQDEEETGSQGPGDIDLCGSKQASKDRERGPARPGLVGGILYIDETRGCWRWRGRWRGRTRRIGTGEAADLGPVG